MFTQYNLQNKILACAIKMSNKNQGENKLTDEDNKLLRMYQEKYSDRYRRDSPLMVHYLSQPSLPPPIILDNICIK